MISKEKIAEILAKYDPQGLCSMGAPKDEYSSEARMIYASLLRDNKVRPKLLFILDLVYSVFIKQFSWGTCHEPDGTTITEVFLGNMVGTKETYLEPALEIYNIVLYNYLGQEEKRMKTQRMTIELDRPFEGYYHITKEMVIDGIIYEIIDVPINNLEKINIKLKRKDDDDQRLSQRD